MQTVRSVCVVCNSTFESESKSNEKNFPAILSKIWSSFCKSFNVTPSKWQDILDHYTQVYELPFCESQNCRNEIAQLFIYDEKLQSILQRIDRLKATISTKILSNFKTNVHSNPMTNSSTSSENTEIICDDKINEQLTLMRCEIAACYKPKVLLPNLSVFNCATKERPPPDSDNNNSRNSNNSSTHEDDDELELNDEKESKWNCIIDLNGERSWLYENKWPVYLEGPHKGRWNSENCRFKCGTCGCVCAKRSNLACHIRQKHIEPHLFVCGVSGCTSSYGRPHDLKLHQISVHSNERPYKCYCGKAYKLRKVLAIHLRRDHNNKKMNDLMEKQKQQQQQQQVPVVQKRGRGRPPKKKKIQIVNVKNIKGAKKSVSAKFPPPPQLQQQEQKTQSLQKQMPQLLAHNRRKMKLVVVKKKNRQMTIPLKLSSLCPSSSSSNNNNYKNSVASRPCRELSTNLRRETANYPDFDDDEFVENGTSNQNPTETEIDPIAVKEEEEEMERDDNDGQWPSTSASYSGPVETDPLDI